LAANKNPAMTLVFFAAPTFFKNILKVVGTALPLSK